MSRKVYAYNFTGMSDRELLQAFDVQRNRVELSERKGNESHSKIHDRIARRILDEFFDRVETRLDDFGDSPLDRRRVA